MGISRSCCGSFFVLTFLAIVVVFVAIIVKHKSIVRNKSETADADLLEHELVDAVQELRYDLIRYFPNKKPKAMPLSERTSAIKSVPWLNQSSFGDAVETKRPFVLLDSPAAAWEALSWDLWNISTRWPLLNNVLVTEDESFMVLQQVLKPINVLSVSRVSLCVTSGSACT